MSDRSRKWYSPSLLWDGFMVYLALVNLVWIAFDLSYIWFRPVYLEHAPWVVGHYDPVKGIHPHPFTERYLDLVDRAREAFEKGDDPEVLRQRLDELTVLSIRMLEEDPFPHQPREDTVGAIRYWVALEVGHEPTAAAELATSREAIRKYWADDPAALPERFRFFDEKIRPIMRSNYFREYAPDGDGFRDLAWLIDLPFLCVFAIEFLFRWGLAVRRHTHHTWYLYPALHWYDLLGLIPYFRVFRLFRVVSIYLRLHRSDVISVGQDVVSRAVRFAASAIAEEITDMVTVRMLEQAEDRLRQGVYSDVLGRELREQRDAIRDGLVRTLGRIARDDVLRGRAREFLRLNLDQSVASSPALRGVPLPDAVLRRLMRGVGGALFDSLVRTMADTLEDERGREAFERLVDEAVAAALRDVDQGRLVAIVERVATEMLERTRRVVAVREWAGEEVQ